MIRKGLKQVSFPVRDHGDDRPDLPAGDRAKSEYTDFRVTKEP